MFKLPKKIKNNISKYNNKVEKFISGEIPWQRFSGIRVPWGNYSHRGGEVFMSRVRIPSGLMTAEQLNALAYCAKEYGNNNLHITTRLDVQIHQIEIENLINVHQYLKDYELSSRGGGGNSIRNITGCPLAGVCKKEIFDIREDAIALTEYLLAQDSSYSLPRKIKISFSGCPSDCIGAKVNDIGLFASRKNGETGYQVFIGGGLGAKSAIGKLLEDFIPRNKMPEVVMAIKNVFYKHGNRKNKHHNRLRFLIEDIGLKKIKSYYKKELERIEREEYISLRKIKLPEEEISGKKDKKIINKKDKKFKQFLNYNCIEQKQSGYITIKLRIPGGNLDAERAKKLSKLSKKFKEINFRTTPEQNLYISNIEKGKLYEFYLQLEEILEDFLYPETLLDSVACKGSLTCNLGLCNSPGLCKQIEKEVLNNFVGTTVFNKVNIKINGCPNACGHHPVGMIAFHGVVRKVRGRSVPFYKLLYGGKTEKEDTKLAKDTGILIPAKNVPGFLKELLSKINDNIDKNTDIYNFLNNNIQQLSEEIISDYSYIPPYSEDKDFYIDWGDTEVFSLQGISKGECGAGAIEMIQSDLHEAKQTLENIDNKNSIEKLQGSKKALFLTARALLVVRGKDPDTKEEVFSDFIEQFINSGIVSDRYSNIKKVYKRIDGCLQEKKTNKIKANISYAKKFHSHINKLYESMDSAFNFPKEKVEEGEREEKNLLDLKGTPCPMNYVKTKLELEKMDSGTVLEVLLDKGEPINSVPESVKNDGHKIIDIKKKDGFYKVIIKKS